MYKLIIIGLILFSLLQNASAQDRKALANEITNKMSFMKNGYEKRQIQHREDSLHSTSFVKIISIKNIEKDSLRHLLVDNGFYDFNFEFFDFKIKRTEELDQAFIKDNNPQLFKLLSDSTFNKVTYSFQKSDDGIDVALVISKNYIIVDDRKEFFDGFMPGAEVHTRTFKAYSKKKDITFCEELSYSNLIKKDQNKKNEIKLDDNNRFEITMHYSPNIETKYIGIKDSAGNMLSIIKL